MLFRREGLKVYICSGAIDMRYGFHKLTSHVRSQYGMQELLDGHVFVFFGKNRLRLKILFFDGTGLVLLAKRMESGKFMWIGDVNFETVSFKELEQLIHGSSLVMPTLGKMPKTA
jgi:transposase